jgi:hypothetical protein
LFVFALPGNLGQMLFRRLSPSFRHAADDPMTAPETFAELAASMRDVRIRDYGFTLRQGLDTVEVDLIAQGDWEGEGHKEWLLACTVTPDDALGSRTYYLALPDLEAEGMLTARVLAVFECTDYDCVLHLPRAGAFSYAPEPPVLESMPGQRTITHPPENPPAPPAAATHKPKAPKRRVR